jgi:hypothetical protein
MPDDELDDILGRIAASGGDAATVSQADIDALVGEVRDLEDQLSAATAADNVIWARRVQVVANLRAIAQAIEDGRDDEEGTLLSRIEQQTDELADLRARSADLNTGEISGRLQNARNALRLALDAQPLMKRA